MHITEQEAIEILGEPTPAPRIPRTRPYSVRLCLALFGLFWAGLLGLAWWVAH